MSLYSHFEKADNFSTSNLDGTNSPNTTSPRSYSSTPVQVSSKEMNEQAQEDEADDVSSQLPPKVASKHHSVGATKKVEKNGRKKKIAIKDNRPFINIRLRDSILKAIVNSPKFKNENSKRKNDVTLYFASIAPLESDHINVHSNRLKDLDLRYCAAIYLPIDKSFTIHSILSTEFMTAMKKAALREPNNNDNNSDNSESKNEENKNDSSMNSGSLNTSLAYHPSDQAAFHAMKKRVVIYIPGNNYTYDEFTACETIMNESLALSFDLPTLVIPFIWPCEGGLLDYDINKLQAKRCSMLFTSFIKRIYSLFGIIDFVGHGKGCTILMRSLEQIQRDRVEIISNKSHIVCIAPDIVETQFIKHCQSIQHNIKRITLYVNTWDWQLFASKWWNWTDNRAGATIIVDNIKLKKLDTIDTTNLLAGWFSGNHWYFTNKYFKNDIKQALSIIGGFAPKYRNYVLPRNSANGKYYELSKIPYFKPNPNDDKKNNKLWNKRLQALQKGRQKQLLQNDHKSEEFDDNNDNSNSNDLKSKMKEKIDSQKLNYQKKNRAKSGYLELDAGTMEENSRGGYIAPNDGNNGNVNGNNNNNGNNERSETSGKVVWSAENMKRKKEENAAKDVEKALKQMGYADMLGYGDDDDDDDDEQDNGNNGFNISIQSNIR